MKSLIFICLIIISLGCDSKSETGSLTPLNDTAKTFNALFNEQFLRRNMPGYGAQGAGKKGIFGDTILFEFNDSLDKYIPMHFANHYIKRITRDSICKLLKRMYNDTLDFPDFMRILSFQKIDSGYNINLETTCVMMDYSNSKVDANLPCIFGMVCGGSVSVDAVKRQDSIYLVKKGSWSD
jgi:hypothetical protein